MKKLFTFLFAVSLLMSARVSAQVDPDLVGTWLSTGDNIAPLLQVIFQDQIDSIYATFGDDQTYLVHQVQLDGSVITYSGVYSAAASSVGNIWTIQIEQSVPLSATVEGIYEIDLTQDPDFMQYEVVQTSGTPNTPPTPEGGFGSTNGGAFGMDNVQKYIRLLPSAVDESPSSPYKYSLDQNYPNPFNPATKINYSLEKPGNVRISVFNILGQNVSTLVNGFQNAGKYTVDFNAKNLNSGIYFFKIESNNFVATRKMMLIK